MAWKNIKRPSAGLPWMAAVDPKKWVDFNVDLDSIEEVSDAGPNGDWNAYRAEMSDIIDRDGDEVAEDGEHEVPFWAMMPFFDAIAETGRQKGRVSLKYRRLFRDGKSVAEFE